AKLFGFTPFSILLPQALAGVFSVALLYWLVRRHFGVIAGLLAALALALSPVSVVTNRNNTIDSILVFALLLGTWAVLRAAETGRLRLLLLSAAIVGLGFNIKMMEAYLVVPAFGLLYLLAAPRSIWKRIGHLALAAALMLAISLSWALAVDLTPASQRPYVGSTQTNSEIDLAFGYNGIQRLVGMSGPGGGPGPNSSGNTGPQNGTPPNGNGTQNGAPPNGAPGNPGQGQPPQGGPGGGPGGPGSGGVFGTGTPGPLRLFNGILAEQIAWLLPLAILGAVALAWQRRPRWQSDRQQQSLVLWCMWVLTMGIFFSVAGFFHPYYLTMMAPGICALFGIGLVVMWQDYRRSGWHGWLLPLALIVTAAEQIYILNSYPAWGQVLIPLLAGLCGLAALALIACRLVPRIRIKASNVRFLMPMLSVGVLALMLAPTIWGAIPVLNGEAQGLPQAGPGQGFGFGGGGNGGDDNANADSTLIKYLEANQGKATFLVAAASSMQADGIILATNKPVMAMGGFNGGDPILTAEKVASLVSNGTVRFFLLNGDGGFGGPGGSPSAVTSWVTQHCRTVPTSQWQSSSTSAGPGGGFGPGSGADQLYDCASAQRAA
ncbi:MAG: glycosyltransferase family 39 protein, partial [Chloroflexi bacterium]|nr:glycosyltransferase family 39 protein [Chloroflexota bacterium]